MHFLFITLVALHASFCFANDDLSAAQKLRLKKIVQISIESIRLAKADVERSLKPRKPRGVASEINESLTENTVGNSF